MACAHGMLIAHGEHNTEGGLHTRINQMNHVYQLRTSYQPQQSGQTMAEYALVITLIAAAGLAIWGTLGGNIANIISSIAGCI